MKLRWWRDLETQDLIFEGRITMKDYANLDLDQTDRFILQTPVHKASDFLFCAETIFRRAEQRAEAKKSDPQLLLTHEASDAES